MISPTKLGRMIEKVAGTKKFNFFDLFEVIRTVPPRVDITFTPYYTTTSNEEYYNSDSTADSIEINSYENSTVYYNK